MIDIDIVKMHLATGVMGKCVVILDDMNGPTTVNAGHVMVARQMNIRGMNEAQIAERLQKYIAIAFYQYDAEQEFIRFGVLESPEIKEFIEKRNAIEMRLEAHINRQKAFSKRTFGPGERLQGVLDHIRKELVEIEESGGKDLEEWVDAWLLIIDGMWRQGWKAKEITEAIEAKFQKNLNRQWPDWRTQDPNKAITHIKTELPPPMPVHSFETKMGRPFKDD